MNKKKILNDPVYGFITIPSSLIFDIIEHPYFQRLRRIKQLGLTDLVYPGALHTRFHHALGAMHLMSITLDNLRTKGIEISDPEYEASLIAILLHDIGHGPFSHALEHSLLKGIKHEELTIRIMQKLNSEFSGSLDLAIQLFSGTYSRAFFHQLVSSQLDIDRLDYLQRDSFFTGVSEGTIGVDRIIKMLDVKDDRIVVEEKGIYSIENFLIARRLMYWQVYLHKTSVSAEKLLIQIIKRAKYLAQEGANLYGSTALIRFLKHNYQLEHFDQSDDLLNAFCSLDDYDVWGALKIWQEEDDQIIQNLSKMLLQRNLLKIKMSSESIQNNEILKVVTGIQEIYDCSEDDAEYYYSTGNMSNAAYIPKGERINILTKSGEVLDITKVSDLPNIKSMSRIVTKNYLCWPKNVSL